VVPVFPQLSETFIVAKVLSLLKVGWAVKVVCSSSPREKWDFFPQLEQSGGRKKLVSVQWPVSPRWLVPLLFPALLLLTLVRNPSGTIRYLAVGRRSGRQILRQFYLDAVIIQARPDVIHFEFGSGAVGRMYVRERLGSLVSVSFRGHDIEFVGLETPGYYDGVWRDADAVHVLGEHLWRRALSRGCPPNKRHALIPPGVEIQSHETGGIEVRPHDPSGLRLIMVGRLAWSKGFEYGLHALSLLAEQGVDFECRIVGGGPYLESVAYARRQLGVAEQVSLVGAINHSEVSRHLAWADVMVVPSVQEGFSNSALEAQARGVPVVTSDAGGLAENVQDQVTGFVVSRRDPWEMAERLMILARDRDLLETFGRAGRERALRRFSLDLQTDRWIRFYEELLANADSRTGRMLLDRADS
jgi:colanic acid/amylovoran biosynthesis glycosyltransferase